MGRAVPFPPRFRSQVFSTSQRFQPARVPRPCFVPQPFLGFSLQSLPLTEIVYPSRGHWLPCGHPPTCWTARPRSLVTTGFPDARAFDAVAWFPRRLWAPFSRAETRFPLALGSGRLPPVPPASPASELSSPCESVRAFPGFPRLDGRCSPGLLPLQSSLPGLGASDPPRGQHPRFG
jgi:hypothetical protein